MKKMIFNCLIFSLCLQASIVAAPGFITALAGVAKATVTSMSNGLNAVTATVSGAASAVSHSAVAVGQTISGTYTHVCVPIVQNTWASIKETALAGKDLTGLVINTGTGVTKFVWYHPQITALAAVVVTVSFLNRSTASVIEVQFNELEKFVKAPCAAAEQFDLSLIPAKKAALLSACNMYYLVNYTYGIGPWYYREELAAIDDFYQQVELLKDYNSRARAKNTALIQSQEKVVKAAAEKIQLKLLKMVRFETALKMLNSR